jgi:hypothetical protein
MRSERLDDISRANIKTLQSALIAQQYDEVEQRLAAMLAKSVADPAYDFVERDLSNFVDGSTLDGMFMPKIEQSVIDAWVKARPNSAWAHYSAGRRWCDQAEEARGDHFASDVTDEHWSLMGRYAKSARVELKRAIALNPKLMMAWTTLMEVDRLDSALGGSVWQDYIEGSAQRPGSFMLPDQIEVASEPRWGGSYSIMDGVAQKTVVKLDHNPRFWELKGFAASDRGYTLVEEHCTCTLTDWANSLREYNAAVAYADRPTWLAKAGDAAIHLKRYAVAYRYYERAVAYEPGRMQWKSEMAVLQALCDPNWSHEKFEDLRQESVQYGFIEERDYPRVPGDCQYSQAELAWGSEPLPDAAAVVAYNVDPNAPPVYKREPAFVYILHPGDRAPSPDGRFEVVEAEEPGKPLHKLMLREIATGKMTHLYTYSRNASVGFNSISTRLLIADLTPGQQDCLAYDLTNTASHVDLLAEVDRQVLSKDPSHKGFKFSVGCAAFWNDDHVLFNVSGNDPDTHASVGWTYHYDPVAGTITMDPHSAPQPSAVGHN